MGLLPTRALNIHNGIVTNSFYHPRKSYTQKELDDMRIREGYSKELRVKFTKDYNSDSMSKVLKKSKRK